MSYNADILRRARSMLTGIGQTIGYELGTGGRRPAAAHPATPSKKGRAGLWCDCSGFVSWCMGLDRYQPRSAFYAKRGGGYINTDSMVKDAHTPRAQSGYLDEVAPADVLPGDIVVYPGVFRGGKRVKPGHTGIIDAVAVDDGVIVGLRVIDCASRKAPAIRVGDGMWWLRKTGVVLARFGDDEAVVDPVFAG